MIKNNSKYYHGLPSILLLFYTVVEIVKTQNLLEDSQVPCSFWNTVNITDGLRLDNGSFYHNGIIYDYYGTFNYQFTNSTIKEPVEPHLRGCRCSIKPCIRLCCPIDQHLNTTFNECVYPQYNSSTVVNVTDFKGHIEEAEIKEKFSFIYGRPCPEMYDLNPASNDYDKWELFENGTVLRWDDRAYLSMNEYCFSLTNSGLNNFDVMVLNPFVCFLTDEPKMAMNSIYGIAMFISIPFLLITVIIYLIIPELRNLHGKSLCCYLSSLVVGYSCLGTIYIEDGIDATDSRCEALGYTAYFSFMSSFLWLSVITFNLWWNFRNMTLKGSKNESKRFMIYSFYSWGLATIYTVAIFLIQRSNIQNDLKPGIGGGQYCWLDTEGWKQIFYFFGHTLIIISLNIIMFALTIYKIYQVKKGIAEMMGTESSRSNISHEENNVGLFLRLFIVTGITWSMDVMSWLLGKNVGFLFYLPDICNATQGLIIFILFVMRRNVMQLIIKKYKSMRGIRKFDSGVNPNWVNSSTARIGTSSRASPGPGTPKISRTKTPQMVRSALASQNGNLKNS